MKIWHRIPIPPQNYRQPNWAYEIYMNSFESLLIGWWLRAFSIGLRMCGMESIYMQPEAKSIWNQVSQCIEGLRKLISACFVFHQITFLNSTHAKTCIPAVKINLGVTRRFARSLTPGPQHYVRCAQVGSDTLQLQKEKKKVLQRINPEHSIRKLEGKLDHTSSAEKEKKKGKIYTWS